jgi:hypothetical protein
MPFITKDTAPSLIPTPSSGKTAIFTDNGDLYIKDSNGAVTLITSGGSVTSVNATSTDITITGGPITTDGTFTLVLNTVPISKGGTGATTAATAIANLLPSQAGNAGKFLQTTATGLTWTDNTVLINATSTDLTITGGPITGIGTFTLVLNTVPMSKGGTGVTSIGSGFVTSNGITLSSTSTVSVTDLTGVLAISKGGTGVSSLPSGYVSSNGTSLTTSATIPGSAISGNISGNAANVTGIVAMTNGGSGVSSITSGYVKSNGTVLSSVTAIPGSDISGNISGNAANVTGIVALANGGTGASTRAPALNNLLPTQTGLANYVLTTDGTNALWTTGTFGTVKSVAVSSSDLTVTGSPITTTGTINLSLNTVPISKGGTGATSLPSGYVSSNGTSLTTSATIPGSAISGNITGSATNVTGVVAISNGGTGATTKQSALNALLPDQGTFGGYYLQTNGSDTQWAPVTSGTVRSVAISSGDLTVTGSPITSSGTISLSLNTVPLTKGGTGVTSIASGFVTSNGTTLSSTTSIAFSSVTGVVPTTQGGTGRDSWQTGIMKYNGTGFTTTNLTNAEVVTGLGYTPINKAGDTMLGNLILNADPTVDLGAATKQYVDSVAQGLTPHAPVRAATTATLPGTVSYNNGSGGVGATLRNNNTTLPPIDGISLALGDRVLVKNETNAVWNGIYTVTNLGPTPNWELMRATDFDNSPSGEVASGDTVYVNQGSINTGTTWVMTTPGVITIGTSNIVFDQFSGPINLTAGTGISITGTVITNAGVLSNIAGAGIAVSNATGNVTITNMGVRSVAGTANQVTVSAATGTVSIGLPADVIIAGGMTASTFFGSGAGLTNIPNTALVNNKVTIGSTQITLGGTSTVLNNLTALTATNITATNVSVNMLKFNTGTALTVNAGEMTWNDGEGTVDLGLKGGIVNLQIGQDQNIMCYANTTTSLTKGQVVVLDGAQGNRVSVKLALATTDQASAETLGFVNEPIPAGGEGFIITSGIINKINTSVDCNGAALSEGDTLYLSPTIPGGFTKTKPIAPQHLVILGYVVRVSATLGSIYVKVNNGYELDELHDVRITNVQNNNFLVYNSSQAVWVNTSSNAALNIALPLQTGNAGEFLITDGSNTAWAKAISTLTSADLTITDSSTVGTTILTLNTVPMTKGGTGVTSIAAGFVTSNGTTLSSTTTVSTASITGILPLDKGGSNTSTIAAGFVTSDGTKLSSTTTFSTSSITGILPIDKGGTGATSLPSGYVSSNGTSLTTAATIPGSAISGNISGNAANVTGVVALTNGGTGATTQAGAANAILPSQATNTGKYLITDGSNVSWASVTTGTVTSVNVTSTDITVSGGPITTNGTFTLVLNTVPLSKGGTGATTQAGAANAVLPSQSTNAGRYLTTDGSNVSWSAVTTGTVTSVNGTSTDLTITGGPITNNGTLTFVLNTVPISKGGTGVTSIASGYVKSNGTTLSGSSTIPGSDISGNITGFAANVTGVVGITNGGTGATTQAGAANAILPSQAGNANKVLLTDGTNVSWTDAAVPNASRVVSRTITYTSGTTTTFVTLPANALVDKVTVDVTTGFTGGATITVGPSTNVQKYVQPDVPIAYSNNRYDYWNESSPSASTETVNIYLTPGTATQGQATIYLTYSVPS